ncbi:sensor domain-containing diguanylate cyclase [uncultured Ferrimonas sp.]|uniref:sensor domain-containing diguanylate cyclase n=1 Tax=uncultured Ferrimonas sp. TaxID=432640 RepID=UPI002620F5A6|nr:sensor domain-containing diguanylate cyclase [uncultured Ferrimonas sp.]
MPTTEPFYRKALDAIEHHIAIIDHNGTIRFVNQAWIQFADSINEQHHWLGYSYWKLFNNNEVVVPQLQRLLAGEQEQFQHEYCFHSEQQQRWYLLTANPMEWQGQRLVLVSHCDITAQKNTEQQVRELTLQDSLTTLPNRRHFTQFFDQEWRRGARQQQPLSLLLLDIDRFKWYNDSYGHQQGDRCLQQIAGLLSQFAQRPGDLMARYGGEEFVLVLANTPASAAQRIAEKLVEAVNKLQIPHQDVGPDPIVTVSIGVATQIPQPDLEQAQLFKAADLALYQAKKQGRNRFAYADLN